MEIRQALLRELGLSDFVVVDLETTGLKPDEDQIIEIGAIRFKDGQEVDSMETLINPGRAIPDFITRLTGIGNEDVRDAPVMNDVLQKLKIFLGDLPFVGHQVNFDASFIEYQFRTDLNDFKGWDNPASRFKYFGSTRLDTLFLARILLPFLPRLRLGYISGFFGIDLENAHRASDDARATGQIFLQLLDRALALDNDIISQIIFLLFANSKRAKSFFVPLLKFKQENNFDIPSLSMVDDLKMAQQYYNVLGERSLNSEMQQEEKEVNNIDVDTVARFYEPEGALSSVVDNYEFRAEQQAMSREVANGLNKAGFVVAEAGTGTGKSMAYMMPAVEWAVSNRGLGQRVVISTNTKNLQEQLFFKDVPSLFSARNGDFKAVLLKGRSNYLCLDKWKTVMTDINQRLSQDERSRILPLVLWVKQTRTGDIAENASFQLANNRGLWQKFIAEPSYCPGKACASYKDCFLMKAREHARNADLVIVNHALLFSDLATGNSILGEFQNLIIDEAHNVEKTAANHLGTRLSFWTFRNFYHRLYEEEPRKTGTLLQLEYRISKGRPGGANKSKIQAVSGKIRSNSMRLKENVRQFYNDFFAFMRGKENNNTDLAKVRYFANHRFLRDNPQQIDEIRKSLRVLLRQIAELIDILVDLKPGQFEFQDQIYREMQALEMDARVLLETFEFCIAAEEKHYVYWLEVPSGTRNIDVVMSAVPLKIADLLEQKLFSPLRFAAMTSATLSVNNSFKYFDHRVGLDLIKDKAVRDSYHGSPFDFPEQIFLGIADFLPDPRNQDYAAQLFELIRDLHDSERRGTMVLFTSYSLLNWIYTALKPYCDAERILLLAQGKNGNRSNLVQQFKENPGSILLGTDSFWEGVDIPGEALQNLIIPKLPFDVPTEPIIAARMEEIKEQGGNPFFEYSVPEAIIKFRQGFGRLIRGKGDFGAVIACDNRLSRMQYGRQFLNSLPLKANVFFDKTEMISELGIWFKTKNQSK